MITNNSASMVLVDSLKGQVGQYKNE